MRDSPGGRRLGPSLDDGPYSLHARPRASHAHRRRIAQVAAFAGASLALHAGLWGSAVGLWGAPIPVPEVHTVQVSLRAEDLQLSQPADEPRSEAAPTPKPKPNVKPNLKPKATPVTARAPVDSEAKTADSPENGPQPDAPTLTPISDRAEQMAASDPADAATSMPDSPTQAAPATAADATTDQQGANAQPAPVQDPAASRVQDKGAADSPTSPDPPSLPDPPGQAVWRYRVFWGDYTAGHGVATQVLRFEHEARRYRFTSEGRAEGLMAWIYSGVMRQTSEGRLDAQGLAPQRFAEQRGDRAARELRIDAATGALSGDGVAASTVPPGAQDRLSVLMQLGLLARAGRIPLQSRARFAIEEVAFSGVQTVGWITQGEEVLTLAGRRVRALHVARELADPSREPGVEVWLGYDQDFMPLRIRFSEPSGRMLDQVIITEDAESR